LLAREALVLRWLLCWGADIGARDEKLEAREEKCAVMEQEYLIL
jgi:hypothetical protein